MQKITPHLWYDKEAREAAEFYTSVFKNSKITSTSQLHDTPSGDVDVVTMNILGYDFMMISAGPLFKFNPAISFTVICETKEETQMYWDQLIRGGMALMEMAEYPFSEKFGWVQDKYGLTWQLIYISKPISKQRIIPSLMFVKQRAGQAEEAINFYASVFSKSKVNDLIRYGAGREPDKEGTIEHAAFSLEGQDFTAMDSALEHDFDFNEAVSLMIYCKDQAEIDYYWGKLSAVPESEQCGWLKDKFGLSWQVVPTNMEKMMREGTKDQIVRVTEAFLKMKKFDLAELEKAYRG